MIKDIHYYRSFDLLSASEEIRQLGSDRGASEVFADAIYSLVIAAEERGVGSSEIEQVLGKPDRIVDNEGGEVWEYDWSNMHGPIKYTSLTPFQATNRVCRGLAPDEQPNESPSTLWQVWPSKVSS